MKHLFFTLITLVVLLAAAIIGLSVYLSPDDLSDCGAKPSQSGDCRPADVIVAVSGGDTAARAQTAISLYKRGWAPLIIFSGAARDKTGPSNALAMKRIATNQGVPAEDILIERFSENTAENADNTAKLIEEHGFDRVILVTSAYHQRRTSLQFESELGSKVQILNHPASNDSQWGSFWWLTVEGWWLALSELAKIILLSFGWYGK